jgi:peptidoglycan/xylan/chitin deacetylase (PgdA/CDA1 family)
MPRGRRRVASAGLAAARRLRRVLLHARTRAGELRVRWSARQVALALVLHGVGPPAGRPDRALLAPLAADRFARHLDYLQRRYRIVPAATLAGAMRARRRGEPVPVAITFDDDLASHLSLAAPMLRSRGLTATFFLTGATLRGPHSFWWERLQRAIDAGIAVEAASPTLAAAGTALPRWDAVPGAVHGWGAIVEGMAPDEQDAVAAELLAAAGPDPPRTGISVDGVAALLTLGMDVGFHTLRHRALPTLSDAELRRALDEGRDELETITGERLTAIAYPHGKIDERTVPAAHAAGYLQGFTSVPEAITPACDPLALGRVAPAPASTLAFAAQLAAATSRAPGRRRAQRSDSSQAGRATAGR